MSNNQTIQYCSDLHLEFKANENYLLHNPLIPKADILILAGDILPFNLMDKPCGILDFISDNFEMTYWVPGNHEYYHSDIADINVRFGSAGVLDVRVEKYQSLNKKIRQNVILINNLSVEHENVELVFSTLWSHIPQLQEWPVQRSVNDFYVIKNNSKKLTANDFNARHKNDLDFLKTTLAKPSHKKRIVVTHHVPTFMNYPKHYKNSKINGAFVTELFEFIETCHADYWIYGHHHSNTPPFKIGNTTMLTNQLGYVQNNEHRLFNGGVVIEL